MNYQEAEQYLLSLGNLPRAEYMIGRLRAASAIKSKPAADRKGASDYLSRLQFFLNLLGNPERRIPHYIHVTGTSGKGSVCSYLASILTASGARTGLYVSPHPTRLTERWQIDGRPMPEPEFVRIVEKLKPKLEQYLRESPYDMVSFFDLTTAIALYYFAQKKVEWAVVEVGCGGRLDSTNIIPRKDVAVVTTVGLDHTELLGDTKEAIAREKAGIIRNVGAVFTMIKEKKLLTILSRAARQAKIQARERDSFQSGSWPVAINKSPLHKLTRVSTSARGTNFVYNGQAWRLPHAGAHQAKNAALAIDIADYLGLESTAIKRGLNHAQQPLRLEVVGREPLVILDGAHNGDKMKTTAQAVSYIKGQTKATARLHLVIGFSEDKDIRKLSRELARLKPATVACTRQTVNVFRKVADPAECAHLMRRALPNTKVKTFLLPTDGYDWVRRHARRSDIILVTGSIFLSGELRPRLTKRK